MKFLRGICGFLYGATIGCITYPIVLPIFLFKQSYYKRHTLCHTENVLNLIIGVGLGAFIGIVDVGRKTANASYIRGWKGGLTFPFKLLQYLICSGRNANFVHDVNTFIMLNPVELEESIAMRALKLQREIERCHIFPTALVPYIVTYAIEGEQQLLIGAKEQAVFIKDVDKFDPDYSMVSLLTSTVFLSGASYDLDIECDIKAQECADDDKYNVATIAEAAMCNRKRRQQISSRESSFFYHNVKSSCIKFQEVQEANSADDESGFMRVSVPTAR